MDLENLKRIVISREVESVKKKNPLNKEISGPDDFTGDLEQTFKELTTILIKLFQKIFPNSFYKTDTSLILKPDKNSQERKTNYRPISLMNPLVKFIPKKFILFDTTANEIMFFSKSSLLVYKNTTNFRVLILYFTTLLNLFKQGW